MKVLLRVIILSCVLFASCVTGCAAATNADNLRSHTVSALDLLSLRDIGGTDGNISISPDGRSVAFQIQQADVTARTYRLDWFVVPVSGNAKPVHVGSGGELMLSPAPWGRFIGERAEIKAEWSPDGRWIAYLRKDAGQVQVWRARPDGSLQEQVTHSAADVIDFRWKPDGTGIYFQVGRDREFMRKTDRQEADRGYLLDDRFMVDYSINPLWFVCGESVWGTPQPASQKCTPGTRVIEFKTGEHAAIAEEEQASRALTTPQRPAGIAAERIIRNIKWDAKQIRAAWLENEDPKTNPGYGAPLTLFVDGTRCAAPECHGQLKGIWWNRDEVVFLRHEGHSYSIPALYAWRPESSTVRLLYRLDGALNSCDIAGDRAICLHETPTTPRKIVSICLSDGKLATVFDPNPAFSTFELGAIERIEWKDGFGNDTFGHLVYPPGYQSAKRYPLVIVQYRSRGFLKAGVGEEYPIYPLAAQGFLVLSFDKPDDQSLAARWRVDNLKDVGSIGAAEWKDGYGNRYRLSALEIILEQLEKRGIIDPLRIGITGLSDGAGTVDFASFNSKKFAAAAHSGVWLPDTYNLMVNESMRAYLRMIVGVSSGREAVEKWKARSITYHTDKVNTPLLIQVADAELIGELPEYIALKDAGKPIEAYVFPGEYHVKWQPQHKLAVAERTIDWFRFWLKGEEDPAPAKAEQYARWHELRKLQEENGKKAVTPAN